jgi:histidinol-phosphate aminotransferase
MNFDPNTIIRANIAHLKPYTPILPFEVLSQQLGRQPGEIIKLDANENPYGPSPLVAETLAESPYLNIYPDPESRELRTALADYTGLDPAYLLVGLGADELIDLIMRLFIEPGDGVVNCPPTFGMYAFDAEVNGAKLIEVWRQPDFSLDIEAIASLFISPKTELPFSASRLSSVKLIYITSPNNPDGSILGDDDLKRLLALPAIVVLDEAYVEFGGPNRIHWVQHHSNLIVLRTFSKWAGLAGLRVGYGAFPPAIITHLWKIKQPYNVPVTGQLAALASLRDRARLQANVAKIVAERDKFFATLTEFDWLQPYPSHSNFILCRVGGGRQAIEVKQKLAQQGILVRHYHSPGLSDHIRISVGTPYHMARLAEALRQL